MGTKLKKYELLFIAYGSNLQRWFTGNFRHLCIHDLTIVDFIGILDKKEPNRFSGIAQRYHFYAKDDADAIEIAGLVFSDRSGFHAPMGRLFPSETHYEPSCTNVLTAALSREDGMEDFKWEPPRP